MKRPNRINRIDSIELVRRTTDRNGVSKSRLTFGLKGFLEF